MRFHSQNHVDALICSGRVLRRAQGEALHFFPAVIFFSNGNAIDLNVKKSAYWKWDAPAKVASFSRKTWPTEIIEAFEHHGEGLLETMPGSTWIGSGELKTRAEHRVFYQGNGMRLTSTRQLDRTLHFDHK